MRKGVKRPRISERELRHSETVFPKDSFRNFLGVERVLQLRKSRRTHEVLLHLSYDFKSSLVLG